MLHPQPNPAASVPIYRAVPCEVCTQAEPEDERAARLREHSGIAAADRARCTFSGFDLAANPQTKSAREAALRWGDGEGKPFLVLAGDRGVGKTHLAIAAASRALDRGEPVLFLSLPAFMAELRAAVRVTEDGERPPLDRLLRRALEYPAVVLDDLGMQRVTDFADEQLYLLVNERYRHRRRTLITTMRAPGELQEAIASRIQDWQLSRVVRCVGSDYRTRRQA